MIVNEKINNRINSTIESIVYGVIDTRTMPTVENGKLYMCIYSDNASYVVGNIYRATTVGFELYTPFENQQLVFKVSVTIGVTVYTANKVYMFKNSAIQEINAISSDIEITDATKGIILRAPDNARWRITVNSSGILTTNTV